MTVAVAVSGGMDSLLALARLRDQGRDVVAAHARFLPPDDDSSRLEEAVAAQCARFGVPCTVFDLTKAFAAQVIDPFCRDYISGLTPNPCATCNATIKFGLLFDLLRRNGADHIATGHYAGRSFLPGESPLTRGVDAAKDQSYFLSLVPAERLMSALFPLSGEYKKNVPGRLAELGLTPPLPRSSTEACFLNGKSYRELLVHKESAHPGPVFDTAGKNRGRHGGLWRFTIGQRRGLGIPDAHPLYVVDKRLPDNALIVGPREALLVETFSTGALNELCSFSSWPRTVLVQTVYRQKAVSARYDGDERGLRVKFSASQFKPSPGQVAAFYTKDGAVLGGARII